MTVRPFRFAVQAGPLADADALVDHARQVEALGYDELWSYDHVAAGGDATRLVDPFVPLVVAARATQRLRVGPLVLNNELHHPALLARTAATVDRMTGGRLVLGIGTGYAEDEHDAIGLPIRSPGDRVARLGESLEIVRALLDDGAAHVHGEHERVAVDALGIRPLQDHVPILVGGHGRRVVGLAGRFADVFQFTGLTHGDRGAPSGGGFAIEDLVVRSRWLAEAAGERDAAIERSALVQFTNVGADAPSPGDLAERFDLPSGVVERTPFVLSGSLEQVVDKVEHLRELLGITHWVVRDHDGFAPVVDALAGR